jgi:large subunit ribosomal protein L25
MDNPIHVDFLRLGEGAKVRVRVPIHVTNAENAPGIKRGGTVNIVTHTISVLVPADAIPQNFEVDLSGLDINYSRHLSDVKLPPNVKVLEQGDITLVTIVPPSGYAEEMKQAAEAAAAAAAAAKAAADAPPAPTGAPGAAPAPAAAPEKK